MTSKVARRAFRPLLVAVGLEIGCAPAAPPPAVPSVAAVRQTPVKPTANPRRLPALTADLAKPESVADAQRELTAALAAPDWRALAGRLAPQVAFTDHLIGGEVRMASADVAQRWLQERWRPGMRVGRIAETAHYGLAQFETGPWLAVSPSPATLWLGTHRYDDAGQASLAGAWRIDSVVFGD